MYIYIYIYNNNNIFGFTVFVSHRGIDSYRYTAHRHDIDNRPVFEID